MRKILLIIFFMFIISTPVSAMEFTAPEAPDTAQEYLKADTESFGEGLWYIVKRAVEKIQPSIAEAASVCLSLIAIAMLTSILRSFPGKTQKVVEIAGSLTMGSLLIQSSNSLIKLGTATITQMSEYGKLLLPVMTAAMAAQGGATSSAALYTGTALFDAVLTTAVSKLLVPLLYIFLCLCIANSAIGEEILKNLCHFTKWLITWCLKIILYVFTGYIGITGVVSGTADAAAVKAAKLTLSGIVPVVGNIISDASEAILVSAGVMKGAAGVYGLLAIIAVCIGPFLEISVHYLLLKISSAICSVLGSKHTTSLVQDFSGAMGLLLAMTGTVCLMLLISIVCFMKGIT